MEYVYKPETFNCTERVNLGTYFERFIKALYLIPKKKPVKEPITVLHNVQGKLVEIPDVWAPKKIEKLRRRWSNKNGGVNKVNDQGKAILKKKRTGRKLPKNLNAFVANQEESDSSSSDNSPPPIKRPSTSYPDNVTVSSLSNEEIDDLLQSILDDATIPKVDEDADAIEMTNDLVDLFTEETEDYPQESYEEVYKITDTSCTDLRGNKVELVRNEIDFTNYQKRAEDFFYAFTGEKRPDLDLLSSENSDPRKLLFTKVRELFETLADEDKDRIIQAKIEYDKMLAIEKKKKDYEGYEDIIEKPVPKCAYDFLPDEELRTRLRRTFHVLKETAQQFQEDQVAGIDDYIFDQMAGMDNMTPQERDRVFKMCRNESLNNTVMTIEPRYLIPGNGYSRQFCLVRLKDWAKHLDTIKGLLEVKQSKKTLSKIRKPLFIDQYKGTHKHVLNREFVMCDEVTADLTPRKDFMVILRFYRPFEYRYGSHTRMDRLAIDQEITILGSNTLADLADRIFCNRAHWNTRDISYDINGSKKCTTMGSLFPSAFIFVDGVFYVDLRNPHARDHTKILIKWAQEKHIGTFTTANMATTRIDSLAPRFNYPYVFQHIAKCEHPFTFVNARLLSEEDCLSSTGYPRLHSFCIGHEDNLCACCGLVLAQFYVLSKEMIPYEQAPMCKTCLKSYFYKNNKKVCNFQCYHYVTRAHVYNFHPDSIDNSEDDDAILRRMLKNPRIRFRKSKKKVYDKLYTEQWLTEREKDYVSERDKLFL